MAVSHLIKRWHVVSKQQENSNAARDKAKSYWTSMLLIRAMYCQRKTEIVRRSVPVLYSQSQTGLIRHPHALTRSRFQFLYVKANHYKYSIIIFFVLEDRIALFPSSVLTEMNCSRAAFGSASALY